jgi:hypothetical protein
MRSGGGYLLSRKIRLYIINTDANLLLIYTTRCDEFNISGFREK